MERLLISDATTKIGETVRVCGWVKTRRDHGKIVFIDLRDRSGVLQCVITPETENYEDIKSVRDQWSISLEGKIKERPEKLINKNIIAGNIEIEVGKFDVLSQAEELPIDISQPDLTLHLETLLDYRNLTIRNEKIGAIFKVFSNVVKSYSDFLSNNEFIEIKTPKLLSSCTEGGAEFFKVKYFDREAFLAQSPQFYKQAAVGAFERVFEINPVFRAEPHFTSRHVNEFTGLDAEMGFIDSPSDIMDMLEKTMKYILSEVKKKCADEIDLYKGSIHVPEKIPRIKFVDALSILRDKFGKKLEGNDIDPEGERMICEWAQKNTGSDFVFVTDYPWTIRPMYIMPNPNDPKYTYGFDLLYRGIEIASGGQRIHEYEMLKNNMKKKGLDPDDFQHYLEIFRFGMPPHGGWGLGAERIVQKILGLRSIKEAILFPRDVKRLTP